MDKVIVGTANWSELFAKHDFFHKYRYYLQIMATADDLELKDKWYISPRISSNVITFFSRRNLLGLVSSSPDYGISSQSSNFSRH